MLFLILAATGRCATGTLCPTDDELIRAMRTRDAAIAEAAFGRAARSNAAASVPRHAEPVQQVSAVSCDDTSSGAAPGRFRSVKCRFNAHYARSSYALTADLVRMRNYWVIDRATVVRREPS